MKAYELTAVNSFFNFALYAAIWAERDRLHFYISLTGNYETRKDKSGLWRGGQSKKEKLRDK